MDFKRGHSPDAFHHLKRIFSTHFFQVMCLLERSGGEAAVCPVLQLLLRWGNYLVVEAFNLDLAGSHVVKVANKLHQLGDRVSGGTSGFTRVCVDSRSFEGKNESEQAAQARGARGAVPGNPDRV